MRFKDEWKFLTFSENSNCVQDLCLPLRLHDIIKIVRYDLMKCSRYFNNVCNIWKILYSNWNIKDSTSDEKKSVLYIKYVEVWNHTFRFYLKNLFDCFSKKVSYKRHTLDFTWVLISHTTQLKCFSQHTFM